MTLVGLAVLFLWLTLRVDLLIFAGVLLAICLRCAAGGLRGVTGLPTGWAMAVLVLLILLCVAGFGWFFSREIASQIDELSRQLPAAAEKIGTLIGQSGVGRILRQHLSTKNFQTSPSSMLEG